jgi:hypothetical protein
MPTPRDPNTQATLDRLLEISGLTPDSYLYRDVMRGSLEATDRPGIFRLQANPRSDDTVVDVYGTNRVVAAESVGPGLTFAMTRAHTWQKTMEMRVAFAASGSPVDKVGIRVRVADLLGPGGRLYPVHSVMVARAWYCTIPEGSVEVEEMR